MESEIKLAKEETEYEDKLNQIIDCDHLICDEKAVARLLILFARAQMRKDHTKKDEDFVNFQYIYNDVKKGMKNV